VHVVGDAKIPAQKERELRRKLIEQALSALQQDEKIS
jgi:hypothetical protein